jgi:hypothetical protein
MPDWRMRLAISTARAGDASGPTRQETRNAPRSVVLPRGALGLRPTTRDEGRKSFWPAGRALAPEPRKPRDSQGLRSHAPKRTRTSTGEIPHKALNLARLPIPPPARGAGDYSPGCRGDASPLLPSGPATLRTHVRTPGRPRPRKGLTMGSRKGPDEAPAGDLRLHQALLGQVRLPAHGAGHRQGVGLASSRRCTRISRTSRRSGCCGATRPSRARSSCSTASTAAQGPCAVVSGPGLPLVGRLRARSPRPAEYILAEENIEEYVHRCAPGARGPGTRASTCCGLSAASR